MSNKDIIYGLVEKYFSLEDDSLEIFKERLYNPVIDDTYKSFGLDENHRKYWKIEESHLEVIDKSWRVFKLSFPSFVEKYNVTYYDFRSNKITIEKNRIKLLKALTNFYIYNNEPFSVKDHFNDISGKMNTVASDYFEWRRYGSFSEFRWFFGETGRPENSESIKETYKEYIERIIKYDLDSMGETKLSNKELYLVLSCNFEDWFFCSTKNGWSSCLSLYSSYSYWSGLPSLITDTNRAILYITDMSQKSPLNEININLKTDKMICRSWAILDDKDKINLVKMYPSQYIDKEGINLITNSDKFSSSDNYPEKSKNNFELLYFENDVSGSIYFDNTRINIVDENKNLARLQFGGRGIYHQIKGKKEVIEADLVLNIRGGLAGLREENKTIKNYLRNIGEGCNYCSSCDSSLDEDNVHYSPNGNPYCSDCFYESFIYCERCNIVRSVDDSYYVEGFGDYCGNCFDMLFTTCDSCFEPVCNEDVIEIASGSLRICECCFESNYFTCDGCNDNFHIEECRTTSKGEGIYCPDCYEELKDTKLCNECGKRFNKKDENKEHPEMCQSCIDGNFRERLGSILQPEKREAI